jgi:hypothetical protein
VLLDPRSNYSELNSPKIIETFSVFREAEASLIRLIQREENHAEEMSFGLGAFQIYGSVSIS